MEVAIIDLNALRYADNPGNSGSMPSGMTIEEFCHIGKYIGASTQLKAICICGYDPKCDIHITMARNVALVIWYILEGFEIRLKENNDIEMNSNTYTIVPEMIDTELTFLENLNSGRWWLKLSSEFDSEPVMIACTREDYEDAINNVVSDRIMRIFAKI